MRYLLDANAIIGLLKDTTSPLARRARQEDPQDARLSAIIAHELYYGAYKSQRQTENLKRMDAIRFEILPFDKEDAIAASEILAPLVRADRPNNSPDVLMTGWQKCVS